MTGVRKRPLSSVMGADSGSSLVGHKRDHASAVQVTVKNKIQEVLSPQDFGAIGDGVSNDSSALSAALAASAGRQVELVASSEYFVGSDWAVFSGPVSISGNWASINAQSSSGFSNPSNIASVANARISGFSHGIKTPMAGEDCDLFISGATFSQMSGPAIFLGAPFSKAICFASETSASIHRGIYHGDDSAENQPAYGWSVSLACKVSGVTSTGSQCIGIGTNSMQGGTIALCTISGLDGASFEVDGVYAKSIAALSLGNVISNLSSASQSIFYDNVSKGQSRGGAGLLSYGATSAFSRCFGAGPGVGVRMQADESAVIHPWVDNLRQIYSFGSGSLNQNIAFGVRGIGTGESSSRGGLWTSNADSRLMGFVGNVIRKVAVGEQIETAAGQSIDGIFGIGGAYELDADGSTHGIRVAGAASRPVRRASFIGQIINGGTFAYNLSGLTDSVIAFPLASGQTSPQNNITASTDCERNIIAFPQREISASGSSPALVFNFLPSDGNVCQVEFRCTAKNSDLSEFGSYVLRGTFKKVGQAITQIGSTIVDYKQATSSLDGAIGPTLAASGDGIAMSFAGASGIDWKVYATYFVIQH